MIGILYLFNKHMVRAVANALSECSLPFFYDKYLVECRGDDNTMG